MANYIELVSSTRLMCGMQGTGPSSVTKVQGIEEVLVRFVRDAYIDIQNLREDWQWLEATESFSTAMGTSEYSIVDIFGTTELPLKKYQTNSFIITDSTGTKRYMKYKDRDYMESRYLNDTTSRIPTEFTIDPPSYSLILRPIPDGCYNISFRYQRVPEVLSANTDVPALPIAYHNLINYKAVEKMAIYLSSPEMFANYSAETSKLVGQLMRTEIPKMRMMGGRFT